MAVIAAPRRPPSWSVLAVFAAVVGLQVLVALASIDLLSAVRAYVAGESLYSKGQKDAQIHLIDYADSQREADYQRFIQALAVPLGDRVAREELQKPRPDLGVVRRGFLQGRNQPADIGSLIRMFRLFHGVAFMADSIAAWAQGDAAIEQMRELAAQAHARIQAGERDAPEVRDLRVRASALNERLTDLEREFTAQLGAASQQTRTMLIGANLALAILLWSVGAIFVQRSLRARQLAETELQQRKQWLARLIDTVADGVITVDQQGRIVVFNQSAERLFRTDAANAVGRAFEHFIAPRQHGAHEAMLREAMGRRDQGGIQGVMHELTGLRAGGEEFPMEASLSVQETDSAPLVTIVLRDVSEQRAAREERRARAALEASNRAKTEFLSRMSHELRTPLNAVIGFAQVLRIDRRRPLDADQLVSVQHIERAGAHLLALVNDVLDLSRVESGQMTLSLEPVSARAAVDDAVALVSALAGAAHVSIQVCGDRDENNPDGVAWVLADPVRLRQVLVNLLTNAIKYNRRGGQVTVTWQREGGSCHLIVADTGTGMTPTQMERLFEPFNRLGAERSKIDGTGIGLVLSRHLAELMHAQLTIDSVSGRGTTATLRFRGATRPRVAAPAPFMPTVNDPLDVALDVLYAEDNEVNVELVRHLAALRPAVHLRVALSGTAALEAARVAPPDLMLVDMHLGDMDGLQLAERLRGCSATAGIHLVALSADALPEQIRATLDVGFEDYLTKPIDSRALLGLLDHYATQARQGLSRPH